MELGIVTRNPPPPTAEPHHRLRLATWCDQTFSGIHTPALQNQEVKINP
jgi:hypothetical protein